jgi:hypothetical protein
MFMWSNDRMAKRWLLELVQKIMWNGITSSYLQKGHLRCESPLWAFSLGALEAFRAMSTNVSKNMKICKPSFAPPNACMGKGEDGMGWHVSGRRIQQKQPTNEKLTKSSISMNPWNDSWMAHPHAHHFFLFDLRFFGVPMLNVGC